MNYRSLLDAMSHIDWISPSESRSAHEMKLPGSVILFSGESHSQSIPQVCFIKQTHSCEIIPISNSADLEGRTGDGIFTTKKNLCIGIKTADCLPIALVHSNAIAAVHAGWRGVAGGILRNGLQKFTDQKLDLESVQMFIGPSISSAKFEVGPDVLDALQHPSSGLTDQQLCFVTSKGVRDRFHVDLALAAALQGINLGMRPQHIHVVRICTFLNKKWNSFRRDGTVRGSNILTLTMSS